MIIIVIIIIIIIIINSRSSITLQLPGCDLLLRPTQPGHPFVNRENEFHHVQYFVLYLIIGWLPVWWIMMNILCFLQFLLVINYLCLNSQKPTLNVCLSVWMMSVCMMSVCVSVCVSVCMSLCQVGDSIVRKSRETLERAIGLVENTPHWAAKVVYGDTDRSLSFSLCLFVCFSLCPFVFLSVTIFVCLSVYSSVYLSVSLPVCLFLSVCLSVSLFVCFCLSVWLFVCQHLCIYLCLLVRCSYAVCLNVMLCCVVCLSYSKVVQKMKHLWLVNRLPMLLPMTIQNLLNSN